MSICPDFSRPSVKNARTHAQINLIKSHYKYLETYSKLVPHAWIAIIDVKDLTYAVNKCTRSNIQVWV